MFPNIETKPILPKEIDAYKSYISEQTDPIRREMFSYSLVSYIAKNIVPFPVNQTYYYKLFPEHYNLEDFMEFLSISYLRYKISKKGSQKLSFKIKNMYFVSDFIKTFFEYNSPVKYDNSNETVWIFPKKKVKIFISNNFFEKDTNKYFYDEAALVKLIMIMAGFSRYEMSNLDNCPNEELKQINYPSLILANIGLYEKSLIKIRDDINGISVFLDLKTNGEKERLFSKDRESLKKIIIEIINKTEDLTYTIEDFL